MNMIESLQQQFQFPPLKKIDPNTQEVTYEGNETPEQRFGQAAIPAVLIALRHFAGYDEGAAIIIESENKKDWMPEIFPGNSMDVIKNVATYSGYPQELTYGKMNEIADAAAGKIKEHAVGENKLLSAKQYIESQLTDILSYLPPTLHLGETFGNNTLDDRTHKMEGPVSGMMHAISNAFTNADEDERKKKNG